MIKPGRAVMDFSLNLTASEVQSQVDNIKFSPAGWHDDEMLAASNAYALPPMVMPFYQLIVLMGKIPSYEAVVSFYGKCMNNPGFFEDGKKREVPEEIYKRRIHRAYPSLVRDFHFMLLLNEVGLDARYSMSSDLRGADVLVHFEDYTFNVAIFRDTESARKYRKKKMEKIKGETIEVVSPNKGGGKYRIDLLDEEEALSVKEIVTKRMMFKGW